MSGTASGRFDGLTKLATGPARRVLALADAGLTTPLDAAPAAPVAEVLAELAAKGARFDMLRLLALALPAREAIWWGILAMRRAMSEQPGAETGGLAAAEAWVRKPNDDTREAARLAAEGAGIDDETALLALAASMHDGRLGTGERAELQAPPGAAGGAVFGALATALGHGSAETFDARVAACIDAALDIARGGTGRDAMASHATAEAAP